LSSWGNPIGEGMDIIFYVGIKIYIIALLFYKVDKTGFD